MGKVRKFKREDIPQIIVLNKKLFPESAALSTDVQEKIFDEICFNNPWYDEEISSLVYEETDGRISGFLGIIPRKMLLDGKKIHVAISQHLMSDRSTLASMQLFKTMIQGPQDFTMADMAIDVGRIIWNRLGGKTIPLQSIYWRRPLKPTSFAISFLKNKKTLRHMAAAFSPIAKTIDFSINSLPWKLFRPYAPDVVATDLTTDEFLNCISFFTSNHKLKPEYDHRTVNWIFERLANEKRFGTFQKILVQDSDKNILGWYLYNLKKGGRSEVIQIFGDKENIGKVLDHLIYHAWSGGAVELCGRLEPSFMKEFATRYCLFMPGRNWMLVHSRNPEIIPIIEAGDAFLTRLEGDLWFF